MKNLPERFSVPENPTKKEKKQLQQKFDRIYRKVLVPCNDITFNTPATERKFAKYLGGRDQVEIYYQMRSELPGLRIKTGTQLGRKTRLNG